MPTRLHSRHSGKIVAAVSVVVFLACAEASAPSESSSMASDLDGALLAKAVTIPAWVLNPETLPPGLRGTNNCTFRFGANTTQWNFHEDGGCWERPGPDGWTRQQAHRIHVPELAECNGGPGDVSPIRVCQAPGLENPCPINPTTGPNSCAQCVRSFNCH